LKKSIRLDYFIGLHCPRQGFDVPAGTEAALPRAQQQDEFYALVAPGFNQALMNQPDHL
jgi:hypothetical protein